MSESGSKVRVLLVEDHSVFRQALALALGMQPDIEVAGEAGTVAEAREKLENIDVGVFDLDLPDGSGASLVRDLHDANDHAEALVLTASVERIAHARAVEAGAAGLLHKSAPLTDIVHAVKRVAEGESLMSRRELIDLVQLANQRREEEQAVQTRIGRLTKRERDVLMALGEGLSDKEIADRLYISKDTVHTHMVNLMNKLEVDSRMQALIFAVRSGLVVLD